MRVLIVDDSDGMRGLLEALCRPVAEAILTASNGAEAIEVFARFRPDWVLMDISMPVMDGLQATAAIVHQFPGARIVIVSEFDRRAFREAARQAGAVDYLLKDDLTELPQRLRP